MLLFLWETDTIIDKPRKAMNRFNILLGKRAPESQEQQVEVFSREKELNEWGIRSFRVETGKTCRIHILRPDMNSMDDLFCGATVHFFNRFFVCQSPKSSALDSIPSPPAPCCTMKYDGNVPGWRICALIYDYNEECLKYWIFKRNTFNRLRELSTSLVTNFLPDFNIWTNKDPRFQQLTISPCKTFMLGRDKVRLDEVCK